MLAKQDGNNLLDGVKSTAGTIGLGIFVIAICIAAADIFAPTADQTPDERPLFGDTFINIIDEGVYYIRYAIYAAILVGGIIAGIALRLETHSTSAIPVHAKDK